jgi:hypothetical protein
MRRPLDHAHTRHPVHRRTQQLAPLSAPAPRAARTHVSRDPAPQRSGPTGPGDPRTWTCGPLATADQAGRGRGRAGQGSDRPAGHWVQCSAAGGGLWPAGYRPPQLGPQGGKPTSDPQRLFLSRSTSNSSPTPHILLHARTQRSKARGGPRVVQYFPSKSKHPQNLDKLTLWCLLCCHGVCL